MKKLAQSPPNDADVERIISEATGTRVQIAGKAPAAGAIYYTTIATSTNASIQKEITDAIAAVNAQIQKYRVHPDVGRAFNALLAILSKSQQRMYDALKSGQAASAELVARVVQANANSRARDAADKLHSRPGGSREKAKDIREIWATGNYGTREECAEQVHESLKMSFSAARKALRNTPEPKRGA